MDSLNQQDDKKAPNLSELAELIKKNIALNEKVLLDTKRICHYIKWQNIWTTVRFLLIAIPIVLGFLYLPPLIKDYLSEYSSIFPK